MKVNNLKDLMRNNYEKLRRFIEKGFKSDGL